MTDSKLHTLEHLPQRDLSLENRDFQLLGVETTSEVEYVGGGGPVGAELSEPCPTFCLVWVFLTVL